ncbi:MAG TPA: carbon-nitrogen hydrolase family protein [Myxococcota bacterium]|nr:carbon-nitrogen hydrolase family protein [Myxococcota bacterium]
MKTLIAAAQMTSTNDKHENLKRCEDIIARASGFGVQLLGLPENFAFMGDGDDGVLPAEPLEGPTIKRLQACAKQHGIWLALGGFQEASPDKNKHYNTHIVINDQGEIVTRYRKIHLFSVTLPDGRVYNEAKSVMAGKEVVVCQAPFFTMGLSICYDLRFFGLFSALRDKGAELLLIPAAFTAVTGQAHWEVLLRARAIETQSYVLAAAQIGKHNQNRSTHGHAMIIDPWGTVLAQCGRTSHLALAEIDLSYVKKLREQMPVWQHRLLAKNDHV